MIIVKILQGNSPADAEPIIATSDPVIVAAVGRALGAALSETLAAAPTRELTLHQSREPAA